MKLTLVADEMNFIIHWYMDGLHQIHEDCRGQIGSLMTLGKGAAISSSNKMKCNTRSSTETELISCFMINYLISYGHVTLWNAEAMILMSAWFFKIT